MKIFKKGEKVIALTNPLNSRSQPRVKGQLYTVLNVLYCSYCGIQFINICDKFTKAPKLECLCNAKVYHHGKMWTASEHFSRPEELSDELDKFLEEEKYEEACIIRDLIAVSIPGIEMKELVIIKNK